MSFDFSLGPRTLEWQNWIRTFINEVVIPAEQLAFEGGVDDNLRVQLQSEARKHKIWAPQLPSELGGGGFAFDEVAVLLEEAGTSLLGPLALNCAAPDEGNLHLLQRVATAQQRDKYLIPLANGEVRSCFAMTEPLPGAGSDPAALKTKAVRSKEGWLINGLKHLITGAEGASFSIVMAVGGNPDGSGATMFLVETTEKGFLIEGHTRTIDRTTVGGHCTVRLDNIHVGDDQVLGEPGKGFRYAQVRLSPARLTHCMRWLGAARRAHEIATVRACRRDLFGSKLSDLGMAQQMIADNEIDLHAARALLWHTSWIVAQGTRDNEASSRAKVFISEAVGRIVDRSVQLCGGLGTSEELVVGRIYADSRAFRIYDGASETHRMAIARKVTRRLGADSGSTGGEAQ